MSNRWKGGFIQAYFDPLTEDPGTMALYGWGNGTLGPLDEAALRRSSPVQIGADVGWDQINASSNSSFSIKLNGTLWSWGISTYGNLGLNTTATSSSPVQVGALTTWSSLKTGYSSNGAAIKTDGTLWMWGQGLYGVNGQGNVIDYSSPVQVGSDTNWRQISNSSGTAVATKTDGTAWSWGVNNSGGLGLNNTISTNSPIQIGSDTDWAILSHGGGEVTGAIKTDGTLWAWGENSNGAVGQNNTFDYSSPVQIGALTNWESISTGALGHIAKKTDGTLWSWGTNNYGGLGQNTTINYSSPVQIGSDTDWQTCSMGNYFSGATKTDGSLYMWGYNLDGRADTLIAVHRSSPVQVGSLTSWVSISLGGSHTLATFNTE